MIPTLCPDCGHLCDGLATCLKYQEFNIVIENHNAMLKLQKFIKITVPEFRGKKRFLSDDPSGKYHEKPFSTGSTCNQRFMTITFDPRKFSMNELSQPNLLHKYVLNALYELRNLFSKNIILVREYHKSGIPHYHMNYSTSSVLSHACLILRMRYYFAKSLNNRTAIHDRMFNDGGMAYMKKSNLMFFSFNQWQEPEGLEIGLN